MYHVAITAGSRHLYLLRATAILITVGAASEITVTVWIGAAVLEILTLTVMMAGCSVVRLDTIGAIVPVSFFGVLSLAYSRLRLVGEEQVVEILLAFEEIRRLSVAEFFPFLFIRGMFKTSRVEIGF